VKRNVKQLVERVRGRAFSTMTRNRHEIPLFKEEWDALVESGEIKPTDTIYKTLRIRKLWEA